MKILNLRELILLTGCLFTTSYLTAQPNKVELSLEKAIEIALDSNPTIKVAELEITRAEYVLKEGKSALYPTVEGAMNYSRNIMLPVMFLPDGAFGPGSGGAMRIGFENGYNASISASLPVYMPAIYRSISLSKEQLALTIENARASRVNMVNEVKNGYYNIVLAENSLEVLLQNKELLLKNVNDIDNKFKQGMASEYDLLTAQVQYQNLLPVIDRAQSALKISRYMLKVLLSFPQDVELLLVENFEALRVVRDQNPDANKIDLSKNTDLNVIGYQIKLQEHQYRLSRANRIPTVFASFNIATQSQSNDFKIGHYQWAESSLAGLGVKIPIFAGMKNRYKDIQIKNTIQQTEISRGYLESNLNMQASNIISNINSAKSQILSNQIAISQAKKAYEISQTRYRVGGGTILELNSSQVALMQAELSMNQAIYDLLVALSNYDKILGREK